MKAEINICNTYKKGGRERVGTELKEKHFIGWENMEKLLR